MISLFGKLIYSLWHWKDNPVNQLNFVDHNIKENVKNGIDEKCCMRGKITQINHLESYGLVNQAIYFRFDTVCGNEEVSVGDTVFVQAARKDCHHAWKAESVYVCQNEWDSGSFSESNDIVPQISSKNAESNLNCDIEQMECIKGTVTECNSNFGRLDNNIYFLMKHGEADFKPVVGDLLEAQVSITEVETKIISWKPKGTKSVDGIITAREVNCGIINDDVIFFLSSCNYNFTVSCGLKVTAEVVECKQEMFKWRAFSLRCSDDGVHLSENTKERLFDKEGISITYDLDFKCLDVGKNSVTEAMLKNNTCKEINFLGCQFERKKKKCQFSVCQIDSILLAPNSEICIAISCKAEIIGQDSDFLVFEFEEFSICRKVVVTVVDPIQHMLNPTVPFSFSNKNKKSLFNENSIIIPGEKCFRRKLTFSNLPNYPIPKYLLQAVEEKALIAEACPYLLQDLTIDNYVHKFSCLLHLEEIKMNLEMKEFDMFEAVLQNRGEFLSLEVPGLAEGRPSLLIGDRVFLINPCSSSEFVYEGYIHEVQQNDVLLKFNENFQSHYNGEIFNVSFRFNRTIMRRLQQCIRRVKNNNRLALFPLYKTLKNPLVQIFNNSSNSPSKLAPLKKSCKIITWQNQKLNCRQKEAVERILEGRCRPLPYVIFGPPGTGKTVTLVEAVLQVLITFDNSRIIICTPSNSAADLVAQRLLQSEIIDDSMLVRLNSYQRSIDSIPEFIQPICKDKNDLEAAIEFRILISTCSTAGSLYALELPTSHFTHVFLDEVGQLTEPECMIAVGLSTHINGQVIMAGDPQQLGPVLQSSIAKTYGLEISYLERIMQTSLYNQNCNSFDKFGGYDPLLVTMLFDSYRSHPAIMYFPSETFYFSLIKCCVPEEKLKNLCNWKVLPVENFPIIFHGIQGEEFREENSPSWFNPSEVVQVVKYLQQLYNAGLSAQDVGIIAPYKKQGEKINLLISAFNMKRCKIGSVEEFQGQERRAIIISTVRSCSDFVNYDVIHNLGFVSNPKRFNVAITRAMEILIVIGNPYVLSKDYHWNAFIEYCHLNGACIGCELPLSFSNLNK